MCATTTPTIQEHNERPAKVWSSGGANYDQISRGIADSIEHAVLRLDPQSRERVLDLSTGTGWTSRVVARFGAEVIGADIAADLLSVARGKAAQEHLPIQYVIGDAEQLPFADSEFDALISTFGVMFASRQEAAAAELGRVVRKGGRIALTTWTPEGNVGKMFEVMKRYMPPPPAPAPRSPFEWGKIERLRELLASNFELRFERATSFYREPSAEAAWDTFSTGYGPTRTLAAALDPDRRDALRKDFIAFHAGFATDLGISVPREYLLTIGIRK